MQYGITFKNEKRSQKEIDEAVMFKKIKRQRRRKSFKIESDKKGIIKLIQELDKDSEIELITKKFDSIHAIYPFINNIDEIYIATWAITPASISALHDMIDGGGQICWVLLDKTRSYKYIFKSTAYEILKGKVKWKFAVNHAKFITIKLKNGDVYNFVGSMNFTNNPRYENIRVNMFEEDFEFYKNFVLKVNGEVL